MTETATLTSRSLSAAHIDRLEKDWAIGREVIEATGAYTAEKREDLPESLQWRTDLPGIVFALTKPNGEVVYQYRPDTPDERFPKYGQEPDTGSVITLHPWMKERLAGVQKNNIPWMAVAVEGTKQYNAFVEYAPETIQRPDLGKEPLTVVAFGIQGCGNWSEDGVPMEDLDEVLVGSSALTIMFDGDRKTNYAVFQAGARMSDHAQILGVPKVLYTSVAGGKKADLDGVLARRKRETRPAYVLGLLNKADANPGRCPAKPKPKKSVALPNPRIAFEEGRMYAPDQITEVNGKDVILQSDEIKAEIAARIKSTTYILDDLNPVDAEVEHDLEVRIDGMDETFDVPAVPDAALAKVRSWANRAGRGEASASYIDTSEAGLRGIENAIRGFEKDKRSKFVAYRRTGWVQDEIGNHHYLTPNGAIGVEGMTVVLTSRLANSTYAAHIRIPDPAEHTAAEHRNAVREFLMIGPDRLHNPLVWYAVVGCQAYAATGAPPRAGLFVVGLHGSGKTVVTQTAASALGAGFHAEGGALMGSMNGTGNAVADYGSGLHHCHVTVDDVRRRQSPRAQEDQDKGCEALIRASYEGGSARRARQRVDRERGNKIVTDMPDQSCPLVIFTGEYLPSAEAVGSSVERLLSITVSKHDTMKKGETDNMKAIGMSGRPAIAWSGFLRWQSGLINAAENGLAGWVAKVEARRSQMEETLQKNSAGLANLTSRSAKVASTPIVGWSILLDYAKEIGAVSAKEAEYLLIDAYQRISKAAHRHSNIALADDLTPQQRMLDRIKALVAGGQARIEGVSQADDRGPIIGKRRLQDNQTQYVLNPDIIAETLGSNLTGVRVVEALKDVVLLRENGRTGWKVSINGISVTNAIILTNEVWEASDE